MKDWILKTQSLQWLQLKLQNQVEISIRISLIEEGAEGISTTEVEEEAEVVITHLSTISTILSLLPSNHISQILVPRLLDQIDILAKSVVNLVTYPLITIIGWIMPIKANIHLVNLLPWPLLPMLVLHRSNLGWQIVQPLIMSLPI